MDIRQIVEDTLVAPMREQARQSLTVAQEQVATDEALAIMTNAVKRDQLLHMAPSDVDLVLKRISRLQMLADAYRDLSKRHEAQVGNLYKLLKDGDDSDVDEAYDIVHDEYFAIHGPSDCDL